MCILRYRSRYEAPLANNKKWAFTAPDNWLMNVFMAEFFAPLAYSGGRSIFHTSPSMVRYSVDYYHNLELVRPRA